MDIDFEKLAHHSGEWLRGVGPESDIVVSSRIRLARNVAEFPFIARASESDRSEVERILSSQIHSLQTSGRLSTGLFYVDVSDLEELDRQFLVERQLISREHAETDGARAVVIDGAEQFSVMINEEDHLRIQVMRSGLDLQSAWESI
ncbi:MAG: ATP--guanido phosphotransferase, partial [Planctomycetota bacterium]